MSDRLGRLTPGDQLVADGGLVVIIDRLLGSGGQGDVYRIKTPLGDRALKWYYVETASDNQRTNLRRLIELRHRDERFLWPETMIEDRTTRRYGYVMPLRPDGWVDIPALLTRRVSGITLRVLYAMGIGLAEAFRLLHTRGLAYRDISWGNVFFEPLSGRVLICDNDNAVFADQNAEIDGTMKFMAPELLTGRGQPRLETDLYSLAVLLFMIYVNGHPLEGALEANIACMDAEAERRIYGEGPIFIFDPKASSNRPVPGIHNAVLAAWANAPNVTSSAVLPVLWGRPPSAIRTGDRMDMV